MTTRRQVCGLLLAGLTAPWASAHQAGSPVRIATWNSRLDRGVAVAETVLTQAYARLGQPVVFVDLPVRRAHVALMSGSVDGNIFRVAQFSEQAPTLVKVEQPLVTLAARVYARPDIRGLSLDAPTPLANRRVAYPRGIMVIEQAMAPSVRRVESGSELESFQCAQRDLADVALVLEPVDCPPHPLATQLGLTRLAGEINHLPVHHYLAAEFKPLAGQLSAALARMQKSGEYKSLQAQALGALFREA